MQPLAPIVLAALCGVALLMPRAACAQAGPPYLSNDPGTPGNGNWVSGQIDFMSYLGVQILLSDYGLHLEREEGE
jgi:hypothetical protein